MSFTPLIPLLDANQFDGPRLRVHAHQSHLVRNSSMHRHQRGQLLASYQGLLSVHTSHQHWVVPATHCIWIPSQHAHQVTSHGSYQGWNLYIRPDASTSLPSNIQVLQISSLLKALIQRMVHMEQHAYDQSMQQHLEDVMIDEIRLLHPVALGLARPYSPALSRVADLLIAQPGDDRCIEAWAKSCNLSARTLSRHFQQETGFHFQE